RVVVDPAIWTPERLITWTMMHWIPGPYAAFSLYKHGSEVSHVLTAQFNSLCRRQLTQIRTVQSAYGELNACPMSPNPLPFRSFRKIFGTGRRLSGHKEVEMCNIAHYMRKGGISQALIHLNCCCRISGNSLATKEYRRQKFSDPEGRFKQALRRKSLSCKCDGV